MSFVTLLRPDDVIDHASFAEYCHQELGTPIPTARERIALTVNLNDYWAHNRQVWGNWLVLTQTIAWAKKSRKRLKFCWGVTYLVRDAYAAGAVPALEPTTRVDEDLKNRLYEAIDSEADELWRCRLIDACGLKDPREVLSEWTRSRAR